MTTNTSSNNFDIKDYKKYLLNQLVDRNKRESFIYQDIIKDYKELYAKYKTLNEKNQILDRELISLKKFSG